jgi:hypothetical protein
MNRLHTDNPDIQTNNLLNHQRYIVLISHFSFNAFSTTTFQMTNVLPYLLILLFTSSTTEALVNEKTRSRRSFIVSSVGWIALTHQQTAFANSDDPFAAIDSMAEKISLGGSSSNFPNSISVLPSRAESEKQLISDTPGPAGNAEVSLDNARNPQTLQDALKKAKKEKKIDPRTHG